MFFLKTLSDKGTTNLEYLGLDCTTLGLTTFD